MFSALIVLLYTSVLFYPWRLPEEAGPVEITIEKGTGPVRIGRLLEEHGIIRYPSVFRLAGIILETNRHLQAGTYVFQGRLNHFRILDKLRKGDVTTRLVTLREGITAAQMAHVLKNRVELDSTAFMSLVLDPDVTHSLGFSSPTLEGYLYPDTYHFHHSPQPEEVIGKLVSRFREVLHDSLLRRMTQMDMELNELVTLASIVEGEAVIDSERSVIAGVYHNRLKKRMMLQACPTIQYIIPDGPRRLLTKDLEIESPYNTYLHYGLPPGPVNNPGMASILAVLYPADTDYLYLVANGDGSHDFSATMNEHIRAKNDFDVYRRKVNNSPKKRGR